MSTWGFSRPAPRRAVLGRPSRRSGRFAPACETLETRQLLSGFQVGASLSGLASQILARPNVPVAALVGTGTPTGLSPQQLRTAYGVNDIAFSGGIKGDGAGQTIAIIDAYHDPNIAADL